MKLDSLLKEVQAGTKEDTLKADKLTAIAHLYSLQSDYPRSLEYYLKATEIAEKLNDKARCLRYYGGIGIEYTSMANYAKALEYHLKALHLAEQAGNKSAISSSLNSIGRVYMFLPDYTKALIYYQKALDLSEQSGAKSAQAKHLRNIGNTYCKMADYPKALVYLNKSQEIFESLGNKEGDAIGLGIIGTVYLNIGDYFKAMEFTQKALDMNLQWGNKRQASMNLLTIGKVIRDAPDTVLIRMGIMPAQRGVKALEALKKGQGMAYEIKDPGTEKTAWEDLSRTYEKQGDYVHAYEAYKNYILLRDSIAGNETKNNLAIKEMQYDFDKKETRFLFEQQLSFQKLQQEQAITKQQQQEISLKQQQLLISKKEKELQHLAYLKTQAELYQQKIISERQFALNQKKDAELNLLGKEKALHKTELELTTSKLIARENQRNGLIFGSILLFLLAGAIFMGLQRTARERKKSDALLLNILPSEVAEELKQTGKAIAKQYNHVTVLFTDFVNFTEITEQMSPTELVQVIHKNFIAFDAIIEKYGLEKIKTIGDAYLAVCGLPNEVPDHAKRVVNAAMEIREYMVNTGGKFQVRIGIHTGPVVAGIVGVKKYAYDIWGDTVNTANRMESYSEAGKINISGITYELIKTEFACTHRGKIFVKGKGETDMYFVG